MINSFLPTYTIIPNPVSSITGKYCQGKSYVCLQDDSLLDTQIRLIDKYGDVCWESVENFTCDYTPYLIHVVVEYELDSLGHTRTYTFRRVWYREIEKEVLFDRLIKELTKRVHYPLTIIDDYE